MIKHEMSLFLLGALLNENKVEAELGPNAAVHLVGRLVEHDVVELLDHLARPERAEVAATLARGARRVLLGHLGKVRAVVVQLLLDRLALLLVLHENVAGLGAGLGIAPSQQQRQREQEPGKEAVQHCVDL